MLTNNEKQQVKAILQSPQFRTIERIAELLCNQIRESSSLRESEWETLKAVLMQEGQCSGIKRFLQELYNCGND